MQSDLRKSIRHPFSPAEKIFAFCHYSPDDELMQFHVANISKGGIGIIANKEVITTIKARDRLILNHIKGNKNLEFMKNLELSVRWVLNSQIMDNIGIGCGYTDISDSMADQIGDFIEAHSGQP